MMTAMKMIEAPWTPEQVESLNDYQRASAFHPFTCPCEHLHKYVDFDMERTVVAFDADGTWTVASALTADHIRLVASRDGWWCPAQRCGYTQDWAHDFMVDGSWREHEQRVREFIQLCEQEQLDDDPHEAHHGDD